MGRYIETFYCLTLYSKQSYLDTGAYLELFVVDVLFGFVCLLLFRGFFGGVLLFLVFLFLPCNL